MDKLFHIAQGGAEAILWLLIIVSIVSLGIILERWIALRQVRRNSDRIKARLREALQSQNLADLEELAKDRETLEGRALSYGLRHVREHGNASGVEEIFNSFALLERPALERGLNFLATVGSNAPFVGLLGTVLGIMRAFNDLANNVAGADNGAVMAGIAEALVATAVGLVVAIPAVIAYNSFQRQVKLSLQSLETVRDLCMAYSKQKGKA